MRDELREGTFPRLLVVIGQLAELARIEAEFPRHLHLRIGQSKPPPRRGPFAKLVRQFHLARQRIIQNSGRHKRRLRANWILQRLAREGVVAAFARSKEIDPVDLVVINLKATANAALPALLPPLLGKETAVLTLQNGMGS